MYDKQRIGYTDIRISFQIHHLHLLLHFCYNVPMNTTVGEKIKYARKACGVNRSALGRSVGTIYQRIREWEDGINHPKYGNVKKIADSLKVDVRYFMDPDIMPDDLNMYMLETQDYIDVRLNERAAAYVRALAEEKKVSAGEIVNGIIDNLMKEEELNK